MGEQDAGDAEMAEESQRLFALSYYMVVPAVPDIAVVSVSMEPVIPIVDMSVSLRCCREK